MKRRERTRLCWFCKQPFHHAVYVGRDAMTIARDGSVRRYRQQVARYVCVDHQDRNPWEDQP